MYKMITSNRARETFLLYLSAKPHAYGSLLFSIAESSRLLIGKDGEPHSIGISVEASPRFPNAVCAVRSFGDD